MLPTYRLPAPPNQCYYWLCAPYKFLCDDDDYDDYYYSNSTATIIMVGWVAAFGTSSRDWAGVRRYVTGNDRQGSSPRRQPLVGRCAGLVGTSRLVPCLLCQMSQPSQPKRVSVPTNPTILYYSQVWWVAAGLKGLTGVGSFGCTVLRVHHSFDEWLTCSGTHCECLPVQYRWKLNSLPQCTQPLCGGRCWIIQQYRLLLTLAVYTAGFLWASLEPR